MGAVDDLMASKEWLDAEPLLAQRSAISAEILTLVADDQLYGGTNEALSNLREGLVRVETQINDTGILDKLAEATAKDLEAQ